MRDFREIISYLKVYIAQDKESKVYDKDVAKELAISQGQFATLKKRNSIPYMQILQFCYQEGLCCSEVFFEKEG